MSCLVIREITVVFAGFEKIAYAATYGVDGSSFSETRRVVYDRGMMISNRTTRLRLQRVRVREILRGDVDPHFSAPFCVESARNRQSERFHLGVHRSVIDQPSDGTHIAFFALCLFHHQLFLICFYGHVLGMRLATTEMSSRKPLHQKEYRMRDESLVRGLQFPEVHPYTVQVE